MKKIEQYIRDVSDFPKKGVLFKDITPLLASDKGVSLCLNELHKLLDGQKIDKVVGMESRGFFFGACKEVRQIAI